MRRPTCLFVLFALLGLGFRPVSADAQGRVTVYFDPAGTVRYATSPGANQIGFLYIYGEGFGDVFVSGIQYRIDYGPDLTHIADANLPGVTIGRSSTGIAMGFGLNPKSGDRFLIHIAVVLWNTDCSVSANNSIRPGPHPDFPNPTAVATRYPDFDLIVVQSARSVTCSRVDSDVELTACPAGISRHFWEGKGRRALGDEDRMDVVVFGSETVDMSAIDPESIRLQGVAPSRSQVAITDVGSGMGNNACLCDPGFLAAHSGRDGLKDLVVQFSKSEIAAALSNVKPAIGEEFQVTLTGNYLDGTPFGSDGCIAVTKNADQRFGLGPIEHEGQNSSDFGYPAPNPFNPVSRVPYHVTSTQRVHIAVYDVAGRLVENLVDEVKSAGDYVVEWNAGDLPSGVYFYRMKAGDRQVVRRVALVK